MRHSAAALVLLPLLLIAPLSAYASPAPSIRSSIDTLHVRDDTHMHMHSTPVYEINETEILQWHLPTPPSYWSIDIEDRDPSIARYPALIALHALFMSLAFFVALPAGTLLPFRPPPLTSHRHLQ